MKTVDCYNETEDSWSTRPELNTSRCGASALNLGHYVYVFCGMTDNRQRLSSFERLDLDKLSRAKVAQTEDPTWEIVTVNP